MTQLDLTSWSPVRVSVPRETRNRPSIDERFEQWSKANRHVFDQALAIARSWLNRGDGYISAKAILEVLRTSVDATRDEGFRINNDFSAPLSRKLIEVEPSLANVMRLRRRKHD